MEVIVPVSVQQLTYGLADLAEEGTSCRDIAEGTAGLVGGYPLARSWAIL